MFNAIRRKYCKHKWRKIDERTYVPMFGGLNQNFVYACDKCGTVEELNGTNHAKWRFEQEHKGATINDE